MGITTAFFSTFFNNLHLKVLEEIGNGNIVIGTFSTGTIDKHDLKNPEA
jgi:hypothetical protein